MLHTIMRVIARTQGYSPRWASSDQALASTVPQRAESRPSVAARAPRGSEGGQGSRGSRMEWCSARGRIDSPLERARDEEGYHCSMISERCACGCDSTGHTVSARREDRRRARDTSAQVQADRRGIAPPIPVLHGLASYPGSKLDRSAQRLVLGGGLGRRWPNCTCQAG